MNFRYWHDEAGMKDGWKCDELRIVRSYQVFGNEILYSPWSIMYGYQLLGHPEDDIELLTEGCHTSRFVNTAIERAEYLMKEMNK